MFDIEWVRFFRSSHKQNTLGAKNLIGEAVHRRQALFDKQVLPNNPCVKSVLSKGKI